MDSEKTVIEGFLPELSPRVCCLLAESLFFSDIPVFGQLWPRIMTDLTGDKLQHKSGATWIDLILRRERVGTIYTCSGGFIDLGHLRDFADLTRQYFYALSGRRKAGVIQKGTKFPILQTLGGISGEGIITKDIVAANLSDLDFLISVARSIAYDISIMYEITTYGSRLPGNRNSSFSPEDLVSNYLGTYVADKAIRAEIDRITEPINESLLNATFDASVTAGLKDLLQKLGALNKEQTIDAFQKIDSRWVDKTGIIPDSLNPNYLQRRNFHINPIEPWLVQGINSCTSTSFPEEIDRELPTEARSSYLANYFFESGFFKRSLFTNRDFGEYIEVIKEDARERYGEDFDQP